MSNKSIIVTTGEFRKDIRKYLDLVVNRKIVIIDRFGQRFMVSYLPKEVDFIIGLDQTEYTHYDVTDGTFKKSAVSPEGKEDS